MHHLEKVKKAVRMRRYNVASSRLATLLRFCRRPEQSAVDPLVEGEVGDAEELWADVNMLMVTDEDQTAESEPLPDLLSTDPKDDTVDGVIYSDTLSGQQQADCRQVLQQFAELFSITPGQTHLCTHDVDTGDNLPVKNKIFRQSDQVKESIKVEVHKMLELGVIEHSDSTWASPVVLVPKPHLKDGKREIRFCVDYRGLNSVTKTDARPIPSADELIDKLGAAKYLSTFDLTVGYWQIRIAPGSKEKTALSTPDGQYQFTVMPFGLKNAPATFQRLVNQVLAGLESFSAAYFDDIAVFSSNWQDHLVHLKKVLQALQAAGLSIKASKCQIGQGTVLYLGHLVGGGQVQPLQPKMQTILDWVAPKTQTQDEHVKTKNKYANNLQDLVAKQLQSMYKSSNRARPKEQRKILPSLVARQHPTNPVRAQQQKSGARQRSA
ncbi:hypothetical protein NDU88_001396 [Pleurodeles waltl]|uniref:ribonuclease H n=1 Tax=Pleurodeles waltl TaxID=8319 RepID=A0AAV7V7N5_PLEWA|nr:hypothetical protein NDU88_001396 [Pleurodeles waltl]